MLWAERPTTSSMHSALLGRLFFRCDVSGLIEASKARRSVIAGPYRVVRHWPCTVRTPRIIPIWLARIYTGRRDEAGVALAIPSYLRGTSENCEPPVGPDIIDVPGWRGVSLPTVAANSTCIVGAVGAVFGGGAGGQIGAALTTGITAITTAFATAIAG